MLHALIRRLSSPHPRPGDRPAAPPALETLEDRTTPAALADPLSAVAAVDPGRPDEVAVGRLYQGLLNRLPEPAGLAYWTNALSQGATTTQIADAFVHTDEYRRTQVHAAYVEMLGRSPDAAGQQAFVDFLATGGTLPQARTILATSSEYIARNAGDAQGVIGALYRDALGRAPTADEVANTTHADPSRLAASVFQSAEAWRKQASDAYHRFLSRDADDTGLAYWTDRLVKGSSLQSLAAALAGARESTAAKAPAFDVGTLGGDFGPEALSLGPPLVFQAFSPERWIDTRAAFPPANGDGIMTPGEIRTFDILGVASDQGNFLPAGTVAISATLFVVVSTNPSGHWAAYPADLGAVPNIASIYSDHAGAIIASSLILPLGTMGANAGKIKVFSGPGGDIVLDINGVFIRDLNAGDQLQISGNVGTANQGVVAGLNGSTSASAGGVLGQITSTAPGGFSAGVRGINNGTGGTGIGVYGSQAGSGWGVYGTAAGAGIGGNFAANPSGTTGTGVFGDGGDIGVTGRGTNRGVTGTTESTTALVYGVEGTVNTSAANAAGVRGANGATAANANGVVGEITSTTPGSGSAGVRGINNGTGGLGIGVYGTQAGTGAGVRGDVTLASTGVFGSAGSGGVGVSGAAPGTGTGVVGTGGNAGVSGTGTLRGVDGTATATASLAYGVEGSVNSSTANSAGVHGVNSNSATNTFGVLGEATATSPVLDNVAVRGIHAGTNNQGIAVWGSHAGSGWGVNGSAVGTGSGAIGVRGFAPATGTAVLAQGDLTVTGAKAFVDPHPTDPMKQIAYVALEGPEVGTYFRSRGRFEHGMATVIVPESFRLVTDAEGLSVQITPIGRLANVAVQSLDLNQAVLLGSEDVDFFATFQGVRKGYAGYNPIEENTAFRPRGAEDNIWVSLNAEQQRRLVATGIYNADGTVNVATAERLGWAAGWSITPAPSAVA